MNVDKTSKILSGVIAQAWISKKFEHQLIAEPIVTLREAGVKIPKEVTKIKVLKDTPFLKHLVLDQQPLPEDWQVKELPIHPNIYEAYSYIYTKVKTDKKFRKELFASPIDKLVSLGVEIPPGFILKILEDTDSLKYFVIPAKPQYEINSGGSGDSGGSGNMMNKQKKMMDSSLSNVNVNATVNVDIGVNTNVLVNVDTNTNAAINVDVAATVAVIVAVLI